MLKKETQGVSLLGRLGMAVGLILIGAVSMRYAMSSGVSPLPEPADTATAPLAPLVAVIQQNLTQQVQVTGSVIAPPNEEESIRAIQAGLVQEVHVQVGMRVHRGQILVGLQHAALETDARQAEVEAKAKHLRAAATAQLVDDAQTRADFAHLRLQRLLGRYREVKYARIFAQSELQQATKRLSTDKHVLSDNAQLVASGELASNELGSAHSFLDADMLHQRQAELKLTSITADRQAAVTNARNEVLMANDGLETAKMQAQSLANELEAATTALREKQHALELARIRAPLEGIVTLVNTHVGENLSVGQIVSKIAKTQHRWVEWDLDSPAAAHVHLHDRVYVSPFPQHRAVLGEICGLHESVPGDRSRTTVLAQGVPDDTRVGTKVPVHFAVVWPHQVVIPATAIVADSKSSKSYVFVYSPDHQNGQSGFSLREVLPGVRTDQRIAIQNGLNVGEQIALHASFTLLDSIGN